MRTIIDTQPHEEARYDTVGDWFYAEELFCCGWAKKLDQLHPLVNPCPSCGNDMQVRKVLIVLSSKLSDPRREFLIQAHELVEVKLCEQAGVTQEQVDKFDKEFEAKREPGNEDEPGDEPDAPYKTQHGIATGVERILAATLGVDWKDYEKELESLPPLKEKP